jgi:hypothetical protein
MIRARLAVGKLPARLTSRGAGIGGGRRARHHGVNFPLVETLMKRILLLVLVAFLVACASTPRQSDAEKLALYRGHSGEPVKDFQYFGRLSGWTPLGEAALAVWTKPNEAYLLEIYGPCPDLEFAPAIGLSNHMSRVSARFDSVTPLGGGTGSMRIPCRIETIRPLDVKALKQAQSELREASVVERPQPAQ